MMLAFRYLKVVVNVIVLFYARFKLLKCYVARDLSRDGQHTIM